MKAKVTITFTITENLKDYDLIDGKKVTEKQVKQMVKKDFEDIDYLKYKLPYIKYKVDVK